MSSSGNLLVTYGHLLLATLSNSCLYFLLQRVFITESKEEYTLAFNVLSLTDCKISFTFTSFAQGKLFFKRAAWKLIEKGVGRWLCDFGCLSKKCTRARLNKRFFSDPFKRELNLLLQYCFAIFSWYKEHFFHFGKHIYLLFVVMVGREILKRWATYWQCGESEIIALMGLTSHFSISLIPTAEPNSVQWWMICAGTSHPCISTHLGFQKWSQSQYVNGLQETLMWLCLRHHSAVIKPYPQYSLVFSSMITSSLFITAEAVICHLLFCQIFVLNHVSPSACHISAIICMSFTLILCVNWKHTLQASKYSSKVSKGETKC